MTSKWTRATYKMVAEQIRTTKQATDNVAVKAALCVLSHRLADQFEDDNPRFDREKFINASFGGAE